MWPFRQAREKPKRIAQKVIVGLIIGGAIGSIIGRKMMEKHAKDDEDKDE